MSELEGQLAQYIAGLNSLQEQEEAALEDLERRCRAARQNAARIRRAIRELTGEATPKGRPAVTAKTGKDWHVSGAKIQTVLDAIVAGGQGRAWTNKDITEATGISTETVRKALVALREQEKIRRTGTTHGRGGARPIYKLMPQPVAHTREDIDTVLTTIDPTMSRNGA